VTIPPVPPAHSDHPARGGLRRRLAWPLSVAACLALPGWWWLRHQRSAAVQVWAPGSGDVLRSGPLRVRAFGAGETVILLLHGIIASGDSFGAAYDDLGRSARVVVPDLLGFGGSMGTAGVYDAAAHVAALDDALDALGLGQQPITVVGHSMGGVLAIQWAATHPDRVRAVLTFGAPLYLTRAEAHQRIGALGPMAAILAGTGRVAQAVCAWTCRHRGIASWLAVGSRPDLPASVARSGVNHTWAAYSGSLDSLIRDGGWARALEALDERGTRVIIAEGVRDPVPVHGRARSLARQLPSVLCEIHEYADHLLPLSDPGWCRALIERVASPDDDRGRAPKSEAGTEATNRTR
jgi:pimeloyl-ACP methyl ester carboxylesterase